MKIKDLLKEITMRYPVAILADGVFVEDDVFPLFIDRRGDYVRLADALEMELSIVGPRGNVYLKTPEALRIQKPEIIEEGFQSTMDGQTMRWEINTIDGLYYFFEISYGEPWGVFEMLISYDADNYDKFLTEADCREALAEKIAAFYGEDDD